jgi:hypothetical protein
MPSYLHEWILESFRQRSAAATELLRQLDVAVPEYDEIRIESPQINNLQPVEFRADLVLFLARKSQYVLGIVVEVQLTRDERKSYAWPAYVANLRARHQCPACLLVITTEDSVARWAARCISLGPGTTCKPWVIGPFNAPIVTELQQARNNVELAVLSAIEHGQDADTDLAARVISVAMAAAREIDAERAGLYLDFIRTHLTGASRALEDAMNLLGFEYQSDFARRYVAEGKAEGKAEGRAEIILQQLKVRFGSLSDAIQTRVRGATS